MRLYLFTAKNLMLPKLMFLDTLADLLSVLAGCFSLLLPLSFSCKALWVLALQKQDEPSQNIRFNTLCIKLCIWRLGFLM
jgi:hypothetical protein